MDVMSRSYPQLPSLADVVAVAASSAVMDNKNCVAESDSKLSASSSNLPKDSSTSLQSLLDAIGSSSTHSLLEDTLPSTSWNHKIPASSDDANKNRPVNTNILNMFSPSRLSAHSIPSMTCTSANEENSNNLSGHTKSTELISDDSADALSLHTSCSSSINNDASLMSASPLLPDGQSFALYSDNNNSKHAHTNENEPVTTSPMCTEATAQHVNGSSGKVCAEDTNLNSAANTENESGRWFAAADIWDPRNVPKTLPQVSHGIKQDIYFNILSLYSIFICILCDINNVADYVLEGFLFNTNSFDLKFNKCC